MSIGVRQLRETLSEQLAAVRDGHTVTITSHGKPIARLVPVDGMSKFDQLVADGVIRPARRPRSPLPDPVESSGSVSELIDEQRR